MLTGLDKLTDRDYTRLHSVQYRDDFARWLRDPSAANAAKLIAAGDVRQTRRAMSVADPAAGGYLAPEGFSSEVSKRMTASSVMRAVSTVSQVVGNDAGFPYIDDSSNAGRLQAENNEATETDLTVSLKKLPAFAFDSDVLRVSIAFLQDASPEQIEQFLIDALSERCARNLNLYASIGAGAGEPQGIATAATVGVTGGAGQTTTVTFNDLEDLIASVPEAYTWGANGLTPSGTWLMRGSTFQAIRKLTDGAGRPLWIPDANGQTAGTLCGFRVCVNPDMPAMGASAKSIVFGKLSSYAIRDAGVIVKSLRERYAERGQTGFRVLSRHGAGLIDPAGVRAYQNAAS